jgi:hypothetical protein
LQNQEIAQSIAFFGTLDCILNAKRKDASLIIN